MKSKNIFNLCMNICKNKVWILNKVVLQKHLHQNDREGTFLMFQVS
jgi:hypothetical protein